MSGMLQQRAQEYRVGTSHPKAQNQTKVAVIPGGAKNDLNKSANNSDTLIRRHSSATLLPARNVDALQFVSQSDHLGRQVPAAAVANRPNHRRNNQLPLNRGSMSDSHVESIHPALVTSHYKPNDFILMYRDLAELAYTAVKSVISGFNIMLNDVGSLRRRGLHEESGLDTPQSTVKMQDRSERGSLVIWWRPVYTLWYFLLECKCLLITYATKLYHNKGKFLVLLAFLATLTIIYHLEGSHQQYVGLVEKKVLWWSYWVVLGIMSSVGLGTGLHTFVLYLGPFIASVTVAAYECQSLDFPEPPYPTRPECPKDSAAVDAAAITLWSIMSKVRMEAMMWGAGTAIGELPPYFMARAAKLSGTEEEIDDEDIEEILDIEEKEHDNPAAIKQMGLVERSKVYVHDLVHRVGFLGILACASIPNPLFDLAGITCGHFLVPFWTFFGATLIGKAVIKMHIQQLFVIFAFSEHHMDHLINMLNNIPKIGNKISQPFKEYLLNQRAKLRSDSNHVPGEAPWLAWIFEKLILIMVVYFVISIINSFAQSYHKRLCAERRKRISDTQKTH